MDRFFFDFDSVMKDLLPKVKPLLSETIVQKKLSNSFLVERFGDANYLGTVLLALFYDKLLISYTVLRESEGLELFQETLRESKSRREQRTFITAIKKIWKQASLLEPNIPILKNSFVLNKFLDLILIESEFLVSLIETIPLDLYSCSNNFLLLPTIIGNAISLRFRQDSGQVFTPDSVSSFLAKSLMDSNVTRVIDPCCGSGILLLGFLKVYLKNSHRDLTLEIIGVETDPILTIISESLLRFFLRNNPKMKVNLKIINQDFFKWNPDKFCRDAGRSKTAIIMNPPYTRHEKLISGYKSEIRSIIDKDLDILGFKSITGDFLSKRIGLYLYFFIHATTFLCEQDSMTLIIPNAWMDVGYGTTIQRFLLSCFKIRFLVNSDLNKLIPSVDVNTVILGLIRCDHKKANFYNSKVKFISVKTSDYLKKIKFTGTNFAIRSSDHIRVIDIDLYTLKKDNKWGKFFRAPKEYFQMMRKIQVDFITLNEITSIKRGFTTGANEFFYLGKPGNENKYFRSEWDQSTGDLRLYLRNEQIESIFLKQGYFIKQPMFKIEKEYWMHRVSGNKNVNRFFMKFIDLSNDVWIPNYLVKSSKNISRYLIEESDINFVVLVISSKDQLKPGIKEYIKWGESWRPNNNKMKFNLRPTCRTRKPWYTLNLEKQTSCEFLCLMTINDRFIFFYNPYSFYFDARLYGISIKTDNFTLKQTLYLYLNSIIIFFQLELTSRINLGEGGLDVKVYEYASLKLPGLLLHFDYGSKISHYFSKLLQFQPMSILSFTSVFQEDLAFFLFKDVLGYSKEEIALLFSRLKYLVKNRLEKARV
ncbi:MAG: N-6 DNA methylase [Candidatus Hodarchaeales archaeon]